MNKKQPWLAWVLLIGLALIWGSSFILIKRGLVGLTPFEVGSLRIFSAGIVLLPIAIRHARTIPKASYKFLIVIGLASSFMPSFLFAIAQTQLESSLAGVFNSITPIFTLLIGVFFYNQKLRYQVVVGAIVAFAGTVILLTSGQEGCASGFKPYALLILLAALLYAINGNVIKFHLSDLPPLTITSVSVVFAGVLSGAHLLLFTDFLGKIIGSEEIPDAVGYIMLLGVMGTAVALLIFNNLVKLTDPVFTSSVTYIIPLVAICWGLIDGETMTMIQIAGVALILFGVFLTNKKRRVKVDK